MTRRTGFAASLTALLLCASWAAAETVRTLADRVDVRREATPNSESYGSVAKGTVFQVLGRQAGWIRVAYPIGNGAFYAGFVPEVFCEDARGTAPSDPALAPPRPPGSPAQTQASVPRQGPQEPAKGQSPTATHTGAGLSEAGTRVEQTVPTPPAPAANPTSGDQAAGEISTRPQPEQRAPLKARIQPGQSVYVTAFKTTGDPDIASERKFKEEFGKQRTFKLSPSLSASDFVFVGFVEYERYQNLLVGSDDIRSVAALVILRDDYAKSKGDLDALRETAEWQAEQENGMWRTRAILGNMVKKFHDSQKKPGKKP